MQSRLLSVIIPVYCNETTLRPLHLKIKQALENISHEILFVDDASLDHSKEVLTELAEKDPSVRIVTLPKNRGQNRAILEGLSSCSGDRAVLLDADLQDPPEAIPELLKALEEGRDAVFAGRRGVYESKLRRITSKSFKWLLHKILKTPIDAGLFVAINRDVITSLLKLRANTSYVVGMIGYSAKNILSIPVERRARACGFSAYSFRGRLLLAMRALVEALSFKKVHMKELLYIFAFLLVAYTVFSWKFELKSLKKRLTVLEKLASHSMKRVEYLTQEFYLKQEDSFRPTLPPQLQYVPFADEEGIVLSTKMVEIPGVFAPYNASLIQKGSQYFLFFRHDTPLINNGRIPFHTNLGCVELDRNFQPRAPFFNLDTKSSFSEDPRATMIDGTCYLTYNDAVKGDHQKRGVRLAVVDLDAQKLHSIRSFDRRKFSVEKNWMPFAPDGKTLHFVYTVSPHEICQILPKSRLLEIRGKKSQLALSDWEETWGSPRGGTPPQLVDGEYLSFFHSMVQDRIGFGWYIMGAYTFEAKPPYRITKISKYPLLFKGVFSSPHKSTSNSRIRCIYPAGFVLDAQEGKEVIHLSCGENDSAVKILTLDKEALLHSLKPL